MASKHRKRCLTSLIIRETHIEATRRHHLTSIRMAPIGKKQKQRQKQETGAGEGVAAGTLAHAGGSVERCGRSLKK